MKKILDFFSTKVFKQVGDVVDNLFTSEEERLNARNEIFKVLQDAQLELQKMQTEIIVAEANGNWLQRSWRPILMLSFGFIIIYTKFISQSVSAANNTYVRASILAFTRNRYWRLCNR